MDAYDQLGLIVEISATMLGFIAVFVALSGKDGRFRASDRHFIQALVLTSGAIIFLGLMPRALGYFLLDDLWVVATWIGVFGSAVVMGVMAWTQLHMPSDEASEVNVFWHVPNWLISGFVVLLWLYSLISGTTPAGWFVLGTTLLVGISIWCFIAIVFRRFF